MTVCPVCDENPHARGCAAGGTPMPPPRDVPVASVRPIDDGIPVGTSTATDTLAVLGLRPRGL